MFTLKFTEKIEAIVIILFILLGTDRFLSGNVMNVWKATVVYDSLTFFSQ